VDVSDATNPTVVGSITGDITNMNTPLGVAVSPVGDYAYVTGINSDSIAVVNVQNCTMD